ncbi:hypothetical protein GCM10029992_13860 [Glycomyces albus]
MNDFELHYLHQARSSELIAEAEAARTAALAKKSGPRREGLATRMAKTLRRNEGRAEHRAGHYRLAK